MIMERRPNMQYGISTWRNDLTSNLHASHLLLAAAAGRMHEAIAAEIINRWASGGTAALPAMLRIDVWPAAIFVTFSS